MDREESNAAGASEDVSTGASAVEKQLERILASAVFKNLRRLRGLLRFVVRETLAGRGDSIKGSTLAMEVFGRDPATDLDDPIVRISAARLRRALHDYYEDEGTQDAIYIEIPKGSYVPVFSASVDRHRKKDRRQIQPPRIAVFPLVNVGDSTGREFFADGLGEEMSIQLARFQDLAVLAYWTTYQASATSRTASGTIDG